MEPITLILTALATGAGLIAKGTLSEVGKDIYKSLKERIQSEFVNEASKAIILNEYEKDPGAWEKPLKNVLTETGANTDREVVQIAQQFLALVNPQQAAMGEYNVQITGDVQGMVQGNNANVTMTFGQEIKKK